MPLHSVWLGLGANLGPSRQTLEWAVAALADFTDGGFRVSPWYRTAPWGGVEQDDFINGVVWLETRRSAEECLAFCQQLEAHAGRRRDIRWGARTLDVDVLLYDDRVSNDPHLTLPHPLMHERAFVLQPLADLAPWLTIPVRGRVLDLLAQVADQSIIRIR